MRIAVVSDIHGNLTAFEAVLADLQQTSPDLVLHGGDLAESAINEERTWSVRRVLCRCACCTELSRSMAGITRPQAGGNPLALIGERVITALFTDLYELNMV